MQTILSDSERGLLEALVQNSRDTPASIGLQLGKGRNWVSRTIKSLVKKGVIIPFPMVESMGDIVLIKHISLPVSDESEVPEPHEAVEPVV